MTLSRLSRLTVAVAGLCAAQPGIATAQRRPAARAASSQRRLEVITVPRNVTVHWAPDTSTAPRDTGWLTVVNQHPVLRPVYRRGTGRIQLTVRPGRYLLATSPMQLLNRDLRISGLQDPFLSAVAISPSTPIPTDLRQPLAAAIEGAFVYSLTVSDSTPRRVVVFAVADPSLALLDSLYPRDAVFAFDSVAFLDQWRRGSGGTVSDEDTHKVVALLRRGGRVMFANGDIRYRVLLVAGGPAIIATDIRRPSER